VRRWLAAIALVVVALLAAYFLLIRDTVVTPTVHSPQLTATIGSGEDAVGVSSSGQVVRFLPVPDEPPLPQLPLSEVPKGGRLKGPVLEQAKILGAAPAALRPYLARSYLGESGIDIELTSGIELGFGDASLTDRKWKAAAATLADPSITALDYVDLHAPTHPAVSGSGHTLPTVP
jgi:cell division septal protein FtsQ